MNSYELSMETPESELEFENFETEGEYAGETELLGEVEEMELAAELLGVTSEEELDQFLGKLLKRAWGGIKKIARPLGGLLKGIAKKALPFVGGALGSFIPIPGVGTALGSALGGAASKLLEVELEGMTAEDQEFELARRFVRLAHGAVTQAANGGNGANPNVDAINAIRQAAGLLDRRHSPRRRSHTGRWVRRGNRIILHGV